MTAQHSAPPTTGELHQFASSPGDRFWGANDLFAFDAADAPAAGAFGFDPAFDPAGPFDPVGPFELPARAPAPPAPAPDAELSHLFTHLALPPSAPALDARSPTSPQPTPQQPSSAPPLSGPYGGPLSPDAAHPHSPHYFYHAHQQHKAPPPGAPPAMPSGQRGYPPAPPPSHHPAYPPPPGPGPGPGPGPAAGQAPGLGPVPNRLKQDPNEEITTVFLAGFPDDITEREFANFFVFARGFEAASLKFPTPPPQNQEEPYFSLGGAAGPMLAGASGGAGSAAPASGPAGGPGGASGGGSARSRTEQIIGFAKFRTRAEAMSARDYLNGRLVDAERGCVLKTEMAKKNLHTKSSRPLVVTGSAGGAMPSSGPPGPAGQGLGPGHLGGHHGGHHHPSLSHPHPHALHHLPRQAAERYQFLAAAELRNAGLGMGSLSALPPPGMPGPLSPSAGGINSLGEAGSYASGNFGMGSGLGQVGPLSPPPIPLSPGPGSPLGLAPLPLSSSLSLPGSTASSAHTSLPPPTFAPPTVSSRSTSPSVSGAGGGSKGPPGSRVTSPLLRHPGAELDSIAARQGQPGNSHTLGSRRWSPPRRSPPVAAAPQGYSDP